MNASQPTVQHQPQQMRSLKEQADSTTFFNWLTSDELLDQVEQRLPDHRERLFPPTETLSMFLAQVLSADGSCQHIVNQAALNRLSSSLPVCSTHTGAYCRARQRLPESLLAELTQQVSELNQRQTPSHWRWRGRRVLLTDGTTVRMPDTPANQAVFPQQSLQLPGLGFPIARLVGIICLASGSLLNAAIGPYQGKGSGELSLLRQLEDTFKAGDVMLGDALYASYFLLAALHRRGVDVLMEQNGSRRRATDFKQGEILGEDDHLIVIKKPERPGWMSRAEYAALPASLKLREFRAADRTLVTTLFEVDPAELRSLYRARWQVEVDLRAIKATMGMDELRCKSPEMVTKEIWVYLLAYNLIRWAMTKSALQAGIAPRQISFKHTLQLLTLWAYQCSAIRPEQFDGLLSLIAQQRVGQRPGRVEPRALKRRPRAYPLLTKPRAQARQEILDFGHRKKLK